MPRPGGVISPFWLAPTSTSTPQSSIRNSSQASEAMLSTASSAGCPVASIAARTASMSFFAVEAVSTWVISTARIAWALSASSAAAIRAGSACAERPKSSISTSTPMRRALSAQPWPKRPVAATSARSPRENMLAFAASQAPWPLVM